MDNPYCSCKLTRVRSSAARDEIPVVVQRRARYHPAGISVLGRLHQAGAVQVSPPTPPWPHLGCIRAAVLAVPAVRVCLPRLATEHTVAARSPGGLSLPQIGEIIPSPARCGRGGGGGFAVSPARRNNSVTQLGFSSPGRSPGMVVSSLPNTAPFYNFSFAKRDSIAISSTIFRFLEPEFVQEIERSPFDLSKNRSRCDLSLTLSLPFVDLVTASR